MKNLSVFLVTGEYDNDRHADLKVYVTCATADIEFKNYINDNFPQYNNLISYALLDIKKCIEKKENTENCDYHDYKRYNSECNDFSHNEDTKYITYYHNSTKRNNFIEVGILENKIIYMRIYFSNIDCEKNLKIERAKEYYNITIKPVYCEFHILDNINER